jgi:hypothetical protein
MGRWKGAWNSDYTTGNASPFYQPAGSMTQYALAPERDKAEVSCVL